MRGFWGIGIYHSKTPANIGTLWRSAHAFGAAFIYTVGRRYERQPSDTTNAHSSIPLYNFTDIADLVAHLPMGCPLIGVELSPKATPLAQFKHPERACYLLGAEDHGLSERELAECHRVVVITGGKACLNVASAGTVVMYDRVAKTMGHVA